MIVHLYKSKLFTIEPTERFAKEYNVPLGTWAEIWRRYKLLEYTVPELCEYLHIKTGRKPQQKSMRRWIFRNEVYNLAKPALGRGVTTVTSELFGPLEQEVINELLKNMRFGVSNSSRILD